MNKKNVLPIVIIAVIAFIAALYVYLNYYGANLLNQIQSYTGNTGNQSPSNGNLPPGNVTYKSLPSDCILNPNTQFNFCFFDSYSKDIISNGPLTNLTTYTSITYTVDAGTFITFKLNLSSFHLSSSYKLCTNGLQLNETQAYTGDLNLYDYNADANTGFSCTGNVINFSNHAITGYGVVPCMQNQFPFLEVYIFPSNFTGTTVKDFENNISIAQRIFAVNGETRC